MNEIAVTARPVIIQRLTGIRVGIQFHEREERGYVYLAKAQRWTGRLVAFRGPVIAVGEFSDSLTFYGAVKFFENYKDAQRGA